MCSARIRRQYVSDITYVRTWSGPDALNPAEGAADTFDVVRRPVWLGAILVAVLALVGGRDGGEPPSFCSDFHRVDKALEALRHAKATGDFDTVPELVDDVADVYEGIEPPPILQGDWTTAARFFRLQADNARSLLTQGERAKTPADDDARYDEAFTNITDYGIAHCGRVRGKLGLLLFPGVGMGSIGPATVPFRPAGGRRGSIQERSGPVIHRAGRLVPGDADQGGQEDRR